MRKKTLVFAVCMVVFYMQGCATGESFVSPAFHDVRPDRVAVVDVSGDIRGQAPRNQVEDFFSMELLRKGYRVMERGRVAKILEEQRFQQSDVTTAVEAARMGEVLNVPAVVMLDVEVVDEKVTLTGRMVCTETGEVLWLGSGRGGSGQLVATIAGAGAGAAAGSQVGGGSGRTAATIGGAVLGGAAGHTLAPQTARVVQRAIKRMTRKLPRL